MGGDQRQNSYTVDVVEGYGDTLHEAVITSWVPMNVAIRVWHNDIEQCNRLMANKAQRRERDAFDLNAGRMFDLCESLGNRAVFDIMKREFARQRMARRLIFTMMLAGCVVMVMSTLFGLVTVLAAAGCHLLISRLLHAPHTHALRQFFAYRERSVEGRKGEFLDRSWAEFTAGG